MLSNDLSKLYFKKTIPCLSKFGQSAQLQIASTYWPKLWQTCDGFFKNMKMVQIWRGYFWVLSKAMIRMWENRKIFWSWETYLLQSMWNNVTNHLGKCVLIDDTMLSLFLNDDFSDAGRNNVYIWKFWRERERKMYPKILRCKKNYKCNQEKRG